MDGSKQVYGSHWRQYGPHVCVAMIIVGCVGASGRQECPSVPPRVLEIDDFEDRDGTPSTCLFEPWQCYLYHTSARPSVCDVESPGFNSNAGHVVGFALREPGAADPVEVGAGLRTITSAGTIDVTRFKRLTFSAKLDSDSSHPLPPGTGLIVRLGCAAASQGSVPGGFSIEAKVDVGTDWSTYVLELAEFEQPSWQSLRIDPHHCLTLMDGIAFYIQPKLFSRGIAAGKLSIDTVYLQ